MQINNPPESSSNISIFERNIQRAIEKKIISLTPDRSKITYHTHDKHTYTFNNTEEKGKKNPEELVRASYFAELVLDYKYPANKIDFEVNVPRPIKSLYQFAFKKIRLGRAWPPPCLCGT